MYRIFCAIGLILTVPFGYLYLYAGVGTANHMTAHAAICGASAVLLAASYLPGGSRYFILGMDALFYAATSWFVYAAASSSFSPEYTLGLALVIAVIGAIVPSRRQLAAYMLFSVALVSVAALVARDPRIQAGFILGYFAAFGTLTYATRSSLLGAMERRTASDELRLLFAGGTGDALVLMDPIGCKIVETNQHARQFFRMQPGVDDGRGIAAVFAQPEWRTVDAALVLKETHARGEYRRQRAYIAGDGSTFWGDLKVSQVRLGGKILLLARVTDITDLKRMESRLSETEIHYHLLVERTLDTVGKFAPDGTVLSVSGGCRGLLGRDPNEIVGRSIYEFMHGSIIEETKNWVFSARAEDDSFAGTYQAKRKDGTDVWVESVRRKVRDPVSGELREICFVLRDVTERAIIENQLGNTAERSGTRPAPD
jgi:PAS domain S-box-containing protein